MSEDDIPNLDESDDEEDDEPDVPVGPVRQTHRRKQLTYQGGVNSIDLALGETHYDPFVAPNDTNSCDRTYSRSNRSR